MIELNHAEYRAQKWLRTCIGCPIGDIDVDVSRANVANVFAAIISSTLAQAYQYQGLFGAQSDPLLSSAEYLAENMAGMLCPR